MQKKWVILIIGAVMVAIGAGYVLFGGKSTKTVPTANVGGTTVNTESAQTPVANTKYTAEDVAKHATANDCWTIVNNGVYDITRYVPQHPGGDEILAACGKDGTSLFTKRQTASGQPVGSGEPHSDRAVDQLKSYKIGEIQ